MIDDKMNVDLKSVVGGELGIFGPPTEASQNGSSGSEVDNQPLFSQALKISEVPKAIVPQTLPPVLPTPVGLRQSLEMQAKEDRRMFMNDLLMELESELEITPDQLVDAFGKLDKAVLMKPPEVTVGELAQALNLSGDKKEDFIELYSEFLTEMGEAQRAMDEKRTKGMLWTSKEGLPRLKAALPGGNGAMVGDPGEMVQWLKMQSASNPTPLPLAPTVPSTPGSSVGEGRRGVARESKNSESQMDSSGIPWVLPEAAGFGFAAQQVGAVPATSTNVSSQFEGISEKPVKTLPVSSEGAWQKGFAREVGTVGVTNLQPEKRIAGTGMKLSEGPMITDLEGEAMVQPQGDGQPVALNSFGPETASLRRNFGFLQQTKEGQGQAVTLSQEGISVNGSPFKGREVLEVHTLTPQSGVENYLPSFDNVAVSPSPQAGLLPAMSLNPMAKENKISALVGPDSDEDKRASVDLAPDAAAAVMTLDQRGARIADSITQAFSVGTAHLEPATNVGQVVQQAQFLAHQGGGEMKMILNPPGLGEVNLSVALDKGQVKVELITETPEAKRILENSMGDLRLGLTSHNLNVDSIRVDLAAQTSREFDMPKESPDGSQNQARDFLGKFRDQNQSQRQAFMGPEEFHGGSDFRRTHEGPPRDHRGGRIHYIA